MRAPIQARTRRRKRWGEVTQRPLLRSREALAAAVPRRRYRQAIGGVFVELVAQRTDGDAEHVGGVGPIAEAVFERLQNEIALDLGDGAADQCARYLFGGESGVRHRGGAALLIEA